MNLANFGNLLLSFNRIQNKRLSFKKHNNFIKIFFLRGFTLVDSVVSTYSLIAMIRKRSVMSKSPESSPKYQTDVLQKLFLKANVNPLKENPFEALKKIDWTLVNGEMSLDRNLHILAEKYPQFNWALYPNANEILADELGMFDVEVKPVETTVKSKTYLHGRIMATVPKHLIGSKARIVIVQPIGNYIDNWTKRMKSAETFKAEKQGKVDDFLT
jgi:hypothetical protein